VFTIEQIPKELAEANNAPLLTGILKGAERECLRVDPQGKLSLTPHPAGLGAALTHPQITTDFSEALLEFITPPCHTTSDLIDYLWLLQRYTAEQLPDGERLWTNSMPCVLEDDEHIPVAQYGNSNNGIMKTIYRIGLGHRYGRAMQTVAGLHYNFSLPNAFWAFLARRENSMLNLQAFKNERYFGLIRNFRRHYWLLIYLFGASPALCRTFAAHRSHHLECIPGLQHSLSTPYATSLRMGDLGYQSNAQENLYVCYNQQSSYIKTLCSAITRPHPAYQQIGVKGPDGHYKQLNTSLLQIENEFYSAIRPKRTALHGETAIAALSNRGVEYIEVRCLDINPFTPIGITEEQIYFLDTFLLYCALQNSPLSDNTETQLILRNHKTVVDNGRDPNAEIHYTGRPAQKLSDCGTALLNALEPVAELLDKAFQCQDYSASLEQQRYKLIHPDATPSAKIIAHLKENSLEYAHHAMHLSKQHYDEIMARPLDAELRNRMENMARESEAEQRALEEKSTESFDTYLENYYNQYQCCSI